MFESTLPLNLTLLTAVFLLLYIATKALIQAWQFPDLSAQDSEGTWGWWIEVKTVNPNYIYYFGPFSNRDEAKSLKPGYIQDLAEENAEVTAATVLWCKPRQLTYAQPATSVVTCMSSA
jgi:Domain of unknown function (DUF1816)